MSDRRPEVIVNGRVIEAGDNGAVYADGKLIDRYATMSTRPDCPTCGRSYSRTYVIDGPGEFHMVCDGCRRTYWFTVIKPAWTREEEEAWSVDKP